MNAIDPAPIVPGRPEAAESGLGVQLTPEGQPHLAPVWLAPRIWPAALLSLSVLILGLAAVWPWPRLATVVRGPAIPLLLSSALLALSALAGVHIMASARHRAARAPRPSRVWTVRRFWRLPLPAQGDPAIVGRAARWPQALLAAPLALLGAACAWLPAAPAPLGHAFALGAAAIILSFPFLIAERWLAARPGSDASALRAMVLPAVLTWFAAGLASIAAGAGFGWVWTVVRPVLAIPLTLIGLEAAARAAGRCFLPPPAAETARSPIDSTLARMIADCVESGGLAAPISRHLGIDFSRSWALRFLRQAVPPAVLCLLLLSWGLTGAVLTGLDQRKIYERFGEPVAVLHPGPHLILPWPMGRVRTVEFGAVHETGLADAGPTVAASIAVTGPVNAIPGSSTAIPGPSTAIPGSLNGIPGPPNFIPRLDRGIYRGTTPDPIPPPAQAMPPDHPAATPLGAEAAPPPEADRLWEQAHPSELLFVIGAESAGAQNFQIVAADIKLRYRIGLEDRDALAATYRVAEPEALLRGTAARAVARFFSGQTLDGVLGENREAMADRLRTAIRDELARIDSGIDLTAVAIEAIHPPAGAAEAYHAVQAAEILANTSVSAERGRALAARSKAAQYGTDIVTQAQAAGAEATGTATADLTRFEADLAANRANGDAFMLERRLAAIGTGLRAGSLTIVDHRIPAKDAPVMDLRPTAPIPRAGGAMQE